MIYYDLLSVEQIVQKGPTLFLGMIQADRAELFAELHPVWLLRKPPCRIAATSHLYLSLLGTVPPAFAGRAGSLVIQLYICIDIIILAVYELVRAEMQV